MKEFNENDAVQAMAAVLAPERRNEDSITEVLDLIFDCYEDNGQLDLDDEADEMTPDEIVEYISRLLRKNPPAVAFTDAELLAMVEAELDYEDSLLD